MGAREKAQEGLDLIKQAIVEFVTQHPQGVTNAEIARELGIKSNYEGEHPDYLSWSVIGLLIEDNRISYLTEGRSKLYFVRV